MEPKTHELKTIDPYFQALLDGDKTYEFRRKDRPYEVGDRLVLKEYDPITDTYSGREVVRYISRVDSLEGDLNWLILNGIIMHKPTNNKGYAILSFTSTIEKVGE
jgi:hypothetical protein